MARRGPHFSTKALLNIVVLAMKQKGGMSHVRLNYELRYVACELADARIESKPVMCVYYDLHFARSEADGGIHHVALDERDLRKVYKGTLKATSDYRVGNRVPETACVGFASYAMRRNEYGMACYTEAGTAHVRIGDIVAQVKKRGFYESEDIPLLMETTRLNGGEPVEKGRFRFRVTALELGPAVALVPVNQCVLGAPLDQIDARLSEFIESRAQFESRMPDTWPGIKNVRAPMDMSSAGIELTHGIFLPVDAFALSEPIVMNVEYFQNALVRCMARREMLRVKTDFRALDLAHKTELMAEICTYAAQSFDYISDTVDQSNRMRDAQYDPRLRAPAEIFSNAAATLAGDCEDLCKLEQDHFNAFVALKIDASVYPELAELQQRAREYVFFMSLATVHGAKAEDKEEHIGAHLFGVMLPKAQVRMCLERGGAEGRKLLAAIGGADVLQSTEGLPTLFCEGTGRIRPLGTGPTVQEVFQEAQQKRLISDRVNHPRSYDPLIEERQYVSARLQSKGGLKMEIPHDAGAASPFYLGNLLGITSQFITEFGYNTGAFIFASVTPQGHTRGAQFVDLINQRQNVALVPHQPMPDDVMAIVNEASALRAPPRPFTLSKLPSPGGLVPPSKETALLDRLKTRVAQAGRTGHSPYGSVDVFMRPHQFNAASIDRMAQELVQMTRVYRVDYEHEAITDKVHTYRVRIFVDRNQ
jgi:hypothetical protein